MAILLVDEVCPSFKGKLHLRMDVTFVDHIVRVSRLRLDWTRCTKDIPDNQINNVAACAARQNCLTADPSISRRNALFLKNLRGHLSDSSKVVTTSQVNCSSLTRSTCAETCQVNRNFWSSNLQKLIPVLERLHCYRTASPNGNYSVNECRAAWRPLQMQLTFETWRFNI